MVKLYAWKEKTPVTDASELKIEIVDPTTGEIKINGCTLALFTQHMIIVGNKEEKEDSQPTQVETTVDQNAVDTLVKDNKTVLNLNEEIDKSKEPSNIIEFKKKG